MDFILTRTKQNLRLPQENWQYHSFGGEFTLGLHGNRHRELKNSAGQRAFLIGDCLNPELITSASEPEIESLLFGLKGNFYLLIETDAGVILANSIFGLLPIFHSIDQCHFSSSVRLLENLIRQNDTLTPDDKFLVHQLLFNFQLGNRTPHDQIKLLSVFTYVKIASQETVFKTYFHISELFIDKPKPWKKALNSMADSFIKEVGPYIPENNSVISFTGGFDGRCLVSLGLHAKKHFSTFSYGKPENDDVYIPESNAKELGLPYSWLDLGTSAYTDEAFQVSSRQFCAGTNTQNGLLYAHVDYSARLISERTDYLLSGICGSELLRATHSAGAVYSQAILDLFIYDKKEVYAQSVRASSAFKYLEPDKYDAEIEAVVNEAWEYKKSLPEGLSQSKMLYVFTCHEVFRKFFGAWLAAQMQYLNVRTPYLDFDFFSELQKTELSGAYSDFLTKNPLKRFKGQMLYAEIIRKTNKTIYKQKTGKGYSPKTLRSPLSRGKLLVPFIIKRFKRKIKNENLDNLGIISGVQALQNELLSGFVRKDIDLEKLRKDVMDMHPSINERDRDIMLQVLSYIQWLKTAQTHTVQQDTSSFT